MVAPEGVKILGLWFGVGDMAGRNLDALFGRVRNCLARWRIRWFSLTGRVVVVQADVLPLINHLAVVFPLPLIWDRRLEKEVFAFVWNLLWECGVAKDLLAVTSPLEFPCLPAGEFHPTYHLVVPGVGQGVAIRRRGHAWTLVVMMGGDFNVDLGQRSWEG